MTQVGAVRAGLRAVRAEWTKLRTVTSTAWVAAGTVAGMVALSALVITSVDVDDCPTPAECLVDTARTSLTGVHSGQLLVAVLSVLAVGNEYASGTVRTTLAAIPGRLRFCAAKTVVVTGVAVLLAGVAVLGCVLVAALILPGNGVAPPSLRHGPTVRAIAGTVLYLGLIALLSLGTTWLVRDTAVALTTVAGLLYLAPVLARFAPPDLAEWMLTYAPMNAGLAVQHTVDLDGLPLGPWAGLGVLAGWAGVALAAGATRLALTDADR